MHFMIVNTIISAINQLAAKTGAMVFLCNLKRMMNRVFQQKIVSETWNVHITNSEGIDQPADSKVKSIYITKYEDNDFIYSYEKEAYK